MRDRQRAGGRQVRPHGIGPAAPLGLVGVLMAVVLVTCLAAVALGPAVAGRNPATAVLGAITGAVIAIVSAYFGSSSATRRRP